MPNPENLPPHLLKEFQVALEDSGSSYNGLLKMFPQKSLSDQAEYAKNCFKPQPTGEK